jgi:hypothetical protein
MLLEEETLCFEEKFKFLYSWFIEVIIVGQLILRIVYQSLVPKLAEYQIGNLLSYNSGVGIVIYTSLSHSLRITSYCIIMYTLFSYISQWPRKALE